MDDKEELVKNWLIKEFRYPGDILEPTLEEVQNALKKAEEVFNFVSSILSGEIRYFLNL